MSAKELLSRLWSDYQRERRSRLDEKAFLVLVRTFPALLVAQADGFTDTSEMQRLQEIVAFLCQKEGVPIEAFDWRAELRYLAIDSDFWRGRFLETLRALIQESPDLGQEQAEFLFATAAASTGDIVQNLLLRLQKTDALEKETIKLISEKEEQEIHRLSTELALPAEAIAYLRTLLSQAHA